MLKKARNINYEKKENERRNDELTARRPLMNLNRFLSRYEVFTAIYIVLAVIILICSVFAVNGIENFSFEKAIAGEKMVRTVGIGETLRKDYFIFIGILLILFVMYFKFAFDVRTSYATLNVGQKGTAAWTTREEIERQYIKVHENEGSFEGYGGIPVARDGDHIFIDPTNVNNLIIGSTRSGKGQLIIEPMAEIISRAEKQCSMVITDPKMELSNKMIPELQKRGYDTYLLNLVDNQYSCGYNPLTLIIREYKLGNEAQAQQLCSSLAHTVFVENPSEKDPFWTIQARNLFMASIMADIEDNVEADRELNRRWKHRHELREDQKEEEFYRNTYGDSYEEFKVYRFIEDLLDKQGDADIGGITIALKQAVKKKELKTTVQFNRPRIEEIMKKDFSLRYERKKYYPVCENEKKINIYSILVMTNTLASIPRGPNMTALDEYFENRPENDFARVTYGSIISASEATKGTILSTFRSKLTIFYKEDIAKMTAENSIDFDLVGIGEKPIAIFIALPDYDQSNWFIATVFINQLYFVLAKLATSMPSNALPRRVSYILDEFGNLPPLDNIGNIFTVCLGRNITFTIAVQSFAQIIGKYDNETFENIKGNCGNHIYVMTEDKTTAKDISETLGTETITTVNRSGKKLSIRKEQTEMVDAKDLMTAEQLMHLEMGETIVMRFMYREAPEKDGEKRETIKAKPIANLGSYRMRYAHTFLSEVFPQKQILYVGPELKRILSKNENLALGNYSVIDGYINTTDYIDLKERQRSAGEYLEKELFAFKDFFCPSNLSGAAMIRKNKVFEILGLKKSEKEFYSSEYDLKYIEYDMIKNGEMKFFTREYRTLKNGAVLDHADLLISNQSPEIRNLGYELYDELIPLGDKPISEEERLAEEKLVESLLAKGEFIYEERK